MSATARQLLCRWHGCLTVGPFSDAQALFEHLVSTHMPSDGTALYCAWGGCSRRSALCGEAERRKHFRAHAGHKPYKCNRTACVAAFCTEYELRRHAHPHRTALRVPESALGLPCRWAACPRAFTADAAGAALLAAHLSAEHQTSSSGCRWADCTRMPRSRFKDHFITHLPAWYKPFKCSICGETFQRLNIFTRHTNGAAKRNGCLAKLRGGAGSGGQRKLTAAADGREAEMPPPFSPATSPRPQESSSPRSSHAPLPQPISPSPAPFPGEEDLDVSEIANYRAVDNHISIAALHARLLSHDNVIREMQAEIATLRRAVKSRSRTPEDDLHLL